MAPSLPTVLHDPWLIEAEEKLPQGSLRRIAALSLLTVVIGFGGFTGWASLTKLESAVPASGVVVSSGKRKTISLLDSGILQALLVHEGDKVVPGQVLFRMDDVQARTARTQASVQYWAAVARAARLAAEAADQHTLPISDALKAAAAADPAVAAAVQAETYQFNTRWAAFDSSMLVADRKIAQQQAQITVLRAQIAAMTSRLAYTREELRNVDYLMAKGLSTKPRQLDLQSTEADMKGQLGQFEGLRVQALQTIAQIHLEAVNTLETRRSDISRDRADTQAAMADAEQRLKAADDLLRQREIRAPEAGIITDIKAFTPGSSIVAGQPVMDLVPAAEKLLIEGNVAPNQVEHLAVGQRVNVRLTAYKAHLVPVLTGRLTYVGADRQMDANNNPYFVVRAELDPDALRNRPGVVLTPGMPADVLIINGARSALDFFISPITDSLHNAMREE